MAILLHHCHCLPPRALTLCPPPSSHLPHFPPPSPSIAPFLSPPPLALALARSPPLAPFLSPLPFSLTCPYSPSPLQDIEGVVGSDETITVVQTRPQV